jgi:hypothetical protein
VLLHLSHPPLNPFKAPSDTDNIMNTVRYLKVLKIQDPNFFRPGSRIRIKEMKYLNPNGF